MIHLARINSDLLDIFSRDKQRDRLRDERASRQEKAGFLLALPKSTVTPDVPVEGARAKPHVLLVEDSEDNREMLRMLLELDGFRVDVAVDGEHGISQAVALRPQIAIVDIGLPTVDGYEVARRLRAALGKGIRLVALTGYGQPEDHARTAAAGFDAHVTKPVDHAILTALLNAPF